MKKINNYILEKLKLNNNSKGVELTENGKLLVDLLKLTDKELIQAIADYLDQYHIEDIVVHVNELYLYNFTDQVGIRWNGNINTNIFKGENSFMSGSDKGNFDIMKWIINGSHDYSQLSKILLYESDQDNISLYGSEWGLYLEHKDKKYELIVLYDRNEKNK